MIIPVLFILSFGAVAFLTTYASRAFLIEYGRLSGEDFEIGLPSWRHNAGNVSVRKQYHFRPSPHGLRAWDIDRLVMLTKDLPVIQVPLSAIGELDKPYWFDHGYIPTCRNIAEHARLINEADLSFPIILSSDSRVMDGMHRVAKAALEGRNSLPAKRFAQDPEPDCIGVDPDRLPY